MHKISNELKKQRYKKLREVGFSVEEASRIRGWKEEKYLEALEIQGKHFKKLKRNIARNKKLAERRKILKEYGYSSKDIQKLQHKGNAFFSNLRSIKEDLYLVVLYKDITENTDAEYMLSYKEMGKKLSSKVLVSNIISALNNPNSIGELGDYLIEVTKEPDEYIKFKSIQHYIPAYRGKGKYLQPLLTLINNMMSLLYEPWRKDIFVADLLENLRNLDNKKAWENADTIEEKFM